MEPASDDTRRLLRLLGRAWLLEPDQTTLQLLGALPGLADAVEGLEPSEAAVEYSQVLLQLVPPYASLFLDDDAMLNADEAETVQRIYVRNGFEILPEWRAGPPDHLGLELLFLAHLYGRDASLARDFLREHLLTWAPVCLLAIARVEDSRLYASLADTTVQVLLALQEHFTG